MKKTFKEVIRDIKEGEVWEDDTKIIECKSKGILIKNKTNQHSIYAFTNKPTLSLARQKYCFQEAFRYYLKGKEIESVTSGCKYKRTEGQDNAIFTDEIQGYWYICD